MLLRVKILDDNSKQSPKLELINDTFNAIKNTYPHQIQPNFTNKKHPKKHIFRKKRNQIKIAPSWSLRHNQRANHKLEAFPSAADINIFINGVFIYPFHLVWLLFYENGCSLVHLQCLLIFVEDFLLPINPHSSL